ncbi:hypothetical protein NDU88_005618 [Pleurodeles waltl]|uniref:Uncharacterized protein n=1 Tax=Pleurodeles waltl TaxID=8319 RepID=A0AAV7QLI4_PLEWA|nr:hypothetical protein NDU88_005618 [Pleurodeles waltl]
MERCSCCSLSPADAAPTCLVSTGGWEGDGARGREVGGARRGSPTLPLCTGCHLGVQQIKLPEEGEKKKQFLEGVLSSAIMVGVCFSLPFLPIPSTHPVPDLATLFLERGRLQCILSLLRLLGPP